MCLDSSVKQKAYGPISLSNLWRDTSGHKAHQDTTMDAMEDENSELRSQQLLVLLTWQLDIKYGPCHQYKMPLLLRYRCYASA
ncbi:hypothetical protein ACSBR1_008134 [Camellia fascicularis]